MAYNSAYTGSQVDAAVGAVRQKETIWDGKQDELTGTEDQLVGFNSAGEATAVPKPTAADIGAMPAVSGGTAGQVLTKTEAGQEWQDAPDGLPEGGTDGQILTKTADGVAWEDPPEDGVTSFNGRTGAVTPQTGDYTADMVGARADTWTPSAEDVGARPDTWTPTASDVGAVPTTRTINSKPLSSNITLTADDVGAASPPSSTTITLTASGWSSNTQTVTVSGVSADETAQLIQPMPAIASQAAYMAAGIYCSGQASNSLTFTCQTAPTGNITVYVVMQEVSAV